MRKSYTISDNVLAKGRNESEECSYYAMLALSAVVDENNALYRFKWKKAESATR